MNKFTKQCVAAMASLAMAGTLCVAGAVVANNVAFANGATATPAGKTGINVKSKDPEYKSAPWLLGDTDKGKTDYKITIYKWEDDGKKTTPLEGAEFKIQKVKKLGAGNDDAIDLTKYDDWAKVAKKVSDLNSGKETGLDLDTATTATTGADGKAEFSVGIGLYRIQETKAPANHSMSEARAFYMTLPMVENVAGETKYNYAPYADPKNKNIEDNVSKTVDTSKTVGADDDISYTITAKLDHIKHDNVEVTADDLKNFTILDLAPADVFTDYSSTVVKEIKVDNGSKFVAADYSVANPVDVPAPSDKSDVARKKIAITFTESGTNKLVAAANAKSDSTASEVTVKLTFTLTDTAKLGKNSVTNKAGILPSNHSDTDNIIYSKTTPTTKFASFAIKKVDEQNKPLGGAKFKLFANQTDATNCNASLNGDTSKSCANESKFGEKEATMNAGKTSAETAAYSVKRAQDFYVVETSAPNGYLRDANVHTVNISDDKESGELTVTNIKADSFIFKLPRTGAAGVTIFAIAGMGLVGIGIFVFMRNRKKDEEHQNA